MLQLPKECSNCHKRKWKVVESESKEFFVDAEKGEIVPEGTLIRKIICAYCEYEIVNYQSKDKFR